MHSLVGWAKARGTAFSIWHNPSCAVPTRSGIAKERVGTAYERLRHMETLCHRLCPPYNSLAFGKTKPKPRRHGLSGAPPPAIALSTVLVPRLADGWAAELSAYRSVA